MASGYMFEKTLDFYIKYFALFPSKLIAKFVMGKKNKQMQGNYCKVGQNQRPSVGEKCFTFIIMPYTI